MAVAGYNTVGASTDFNAANDGGVTGPFTVGAGATITEFHLYAEPGAGNGFFRPIIYEDNGGEPGSLIATLAEQTVAVGNPAAWYDITGLSISVGSAAIWIGLWTKDNFVLYHYDSPGGTPGRYKGSLATYSSTGNAPATWPTASDSTSGQQRSVYVVYTPAGGATVTGAASLTTTVGITTSGFKTTTGASSSTFTLGVSTTGHLDWTGSSSSTFALGVATTGTRVVLGSATQTYTVGIASQGTRTTFGSLTETFTVGITTTAATTIVTGAASLTVTFGSTTAGAKATSGSVSLGINALFVTTGVRGKAITFNAVNDGTITLDPQAKGTLP